MLDAIGFDTDPANAPLVPLEAFGSEFVPDIGHIADDLVQLADGSLLAMIEVPGFPFELEAMGDRNIRRRQVNDLLRGIADSNVTVAFHLVRHPSTDAVAPRRWHSDFAREFAALRSRRVLGDLAVCRWFITVIVSPRFAPGREIRRILARWRRPQPTHAGPSVVRQMDGAMRSLMAYFGPAGARRLGTRSEKGRDYSEIATARRMILYGDWRPVPVNGPGCTLADLIYAERVICGSVAVQLNMLSGTRFAKTIAIRDYPGDDDPEEREEKRAGTYTGQLSPLAGAVDDNGAAFPFVMAQTFRFQTREASRERLRRRITRMDNLSDPQKRGREKMAGSQEEVASGAAVRGHHNFALTVFGRDLDSLDAAKAAAGSVIVKAGAVPIEEDMGAFAAYWSMLPGNPSWLEGRSASISSKNLTAFASLESFPRGNASGFWGAPIIRFPTTGKTALDVVPHVGDVGHALFIGRTGSGKTLLLTMLAAHLEPAMGDDGRIIMLDKDQGFHPFVLASGGAYLTLRAGEPSGLAPLRGLPDTPDARAFLGAWIAALMESDGNGPLTPTTHAGIRRGVARVMRLPPAQRQMAGVRAFVGYGTGYQGDRLDRWCIGGADGWMFDGPTDDIRMDARVIGFDLTALLTHPAAPHVAAYILHRIGRLIDGRRIAVIADEIRYYLLSPEFAGAVEDFALTLRKKNGMLWIAAQEPAHVMGSKVGTNLVSQCLTKWVFPAGSANPDEYARLGFTSAAYNAITETMPTLPYRSVLLLREGQSAVLRVDLPGMADAVSILSGREDTVRNIPEILARTTDAASFSREFARLARGERHA